MARFHIFHLTWQQQWNLPGLFKTVYMSKIKLAKGLKLSRIVHGHWRLKDWNLSRQELLSLIEKVMDLGITSFDHADIYGNYSCETLFGEAVGSKNKLRKNMQLITKCGIKLKSDKNPLQRIKFYDYSYGHIVQSAERSLVNLKTDYIDLLLFHRPSPFFDPGEVAKAMEHLRKSGKVLFFGVSNFTPAQFNMLAAHSSIPLVTNQVEISPYCLEHFENGNMEHFLEHNIKPIAWSPMEGGKLLNPSDEKGQRIFNSITEIAQELNVDEVEKIVYSWLLKHPASIIPVVGSSKPERIKHATCALDVNMSIEQWFRIYNAARGSELP
jgi:predicted oxidoreductase